MRLSLSSFFISQSVFLSFRLKNIWCKYVVKRNWYIIAIESFKLFCTFFLSFHLFVFPSFCLFVFLSSCLSVILGHHRSTQINKSWEVVFDARCGIDGLDWDGLVIIGRRYSKSTFSANKQIGNDDQEDIHNNRSDNDDDQIDDDDERRQPPFSRWWSYCWP